MPIRDSRAGARSKVFLPETIRAAGILSSVSAEIKEHSSGKTTGRLEVTADAAEFV
jgi:hypothetical protein